MLLLGWTLLLEQRVAAQAGDRLMGAGLEPSFHLRPAVVSCISWVTGWEIPLRDKHSPSGYTLTTLRPKEEQFALQKGGILQYQVAYLGQVKLARQDLSQTSNKKSQRDAHAGGQEQIQNMMKDKSGAGQEKHMEPDAWFHIHLAVPHSLTIPGGQSFDSFNRGRAATNQPHFPDNADDDRPEKCLWINRPSQHSLLLLGGKCSISKCHWAGELPDDLCKLLHSEFLPHPLHCSD